MSTATTPQPAAALPARSTMTGDATPTRFGGREVNGRNDQQADPRRRGRLVLAEKVIEKIAGQAAAEIGASRGRSGGFLGIGSDADASARPKVDVDLTADSADLAISIGIDYPGSIRRATQQVRDHVTTRVFELTGVRVHRVDIDVSFLTPNSPYDRSDQEGLR